MYPSNFLAGSRIQSDKQYGEWLEIWNQLTLPEAKVMGYNRMIGHVNSLHYDATASAYTIFVPLQFWFCRNPGLSIPLIALQNHDVRIQIEFRKLTDLIIQQNTTDQFNGSLTDAALWADYVYLDTDERRRFAQVKHEYLIDQVQFTGGEALTMTSVPTSTGTSTTSSANIQLYYSHPVKFLAFLAQKDEFISANINQTFNWTDSLQVRTDTSTTPSITDGFDESSDYQDANGRGPITKLRVLLNGLERFATRPGEYFNSVQPYQHFPAIPNSPGLYVYSFGLNPDEGQPSGACNFSRLDTATIQVTFNNTLFVNSTSNSVNAQFRCYALNINVLRFGAGLASLAYVA